MRTKIPLNLHEWNKEAVLFLLRVAQEAKGRGGLATDEVYKHINRLIELAGQYHLILLAQKREEDD